MLIKFIITFLLVSTVISDELNFCSSRGNCVCDCSWTKKVDCKTARDDNSCCFACCCLVKPTFPMNTGPNHQLYCPSVNDLVVGYGNAKLTNQGWLNKGGGSAATKSSFNLLGGYVEYDIELTNVQPGINANIYTISPKEIPTTIGFTQKNYCDGAKTGTNWCTEIDWIESNGNCGGATTLHMKEGTGVGCTAWGCSVTYKYNGNTNFHMKVAYEPDGTITVYRDKEIYKKFTPTPTSTDMQVLIDQYKRLGAVIYSSLWKGWVPMGNSCPKNGDLQSSSFEIKNLKIFGTVVQGPIPKLC